MLISTKHKAHLRMMECHELWRYLAINKWKFWLDGGARWKFRGSPNLLGFILWRSWMSIPNFKANHPIAFEKFWTKVFNRLDQPAFFPPLLLSLFLSLFSKDLSYWTRTKMASWAAGTWGSCVTRGCHWSTVLHHSFSQSHLQQLMLLMTGAN